MRVVLASVAALLGSACTSSPSSVGTITVSAYSNARPGTDTTIPAQPLVGLTVFEEGGESATTDAVGQATLGVLHDPATIHVAATASLTTIVGVHPNAFVHLGNGQYSPDVAAVSFAQADIGATSYGIYAPACLRFQPTATTSFLGEVTATCVNATLRVYAEAVMSSGAIKISEQDVAIASNGHFTLASYVDATSYDLVPTNLPPLPAPVKISVGAVDPQTQMPILLPTSDGPADVDLVELASSDDTASSRLLVQGPVSNGPFDASHMLPVPAIDAIDRTHATWSLAASNATPNLVALNATYGNFRWIVYGPPSTTSVTFPALPAAVEGPQSDVTSGSLSYYELRNAVLTLDENQGTTITSHPIASSRVAF